MITKCPFQKNVGALNNHLARLLTGSFYSSIREGGKKILSGMPPIKEFVKKTEEHVKGFVSPVGTMFEQLGFNYIGPIDGHNIEELISTLKNMRALKGPQFFTYHDQKRERLRSGRKRPNWLSWCT